MRAPSLNGIYGQVVPLQNGSTAAADDAYIQDSILEPNKQVVAGYRPIMPSYAGVISDADLAQLVAYIKSLGEGNRADSHEPKRNHSSRPADPRAGDRRAGRLSARGTNIEFMVFHDRSQAHRNSLSGVRSPCFSCWAVIAAGLIRLALIVPDGEILTNDVYNRMFTLHGVIMVWFFLVPSIPNTLGNFLLPLMIGAKDVAFPRLNLLSWYIFVLGSLFTVFDMIWGGVDTGWTFYTPLSTQYSNSYVIAAVLGVIVVGFSSILTGLNFMVTTHKLRAPGMTWFRLPLFVWSTLRYKSDPGDGDAGA